MNAALFFDGADGPANDERGVGDGTDEYRVVYSNRDSSYNAFIFIMQIK